MTDLSKALKNEIAKLEAKAAKLKEALAAVESVNGVTRRKKFTMSAEAKARISAAQKKRWKARKKEKVKTGAA